VLCSQPTEAPAPISLLPLGQGLFLIARQILLLCIERDSLAEGGLRTEVEITDIRI
jgi:hypothetical protein